MENKQLILPKTDFPMKAGLKDLEKKIVNFWKENKIRQKIKNNRKGKMTLHFGPPYANGEFHMGHGLNVFLKDLTLRSYSMMGYDVSSLIGFDCHGLPIELAVKKQIKNNNLPEPKSLKEFINMCDEFSNKYIDIQTKTLERMGFLKDDGYYATKLSVKEIYEVFSKLLMKNLVYVSKKPCPWSITEKTVISDAEIVYRTKKTKTVDIALEIVDAPLENLKGYFLAIWTTTPWTLVDNVAVAFNENHNYLICETENEKVIIIGEEVEEDFKQRVGCELNILGVISGSAFKDIKCKHPILDKEVPVVHSDHVEATSGTGFVHIAPAHGMEDFLLCEKLDIPLIESVDDCGFYYDHTPILGGKHIYYHEEDIFDCLEGKLLAITTIEHEYPYDTRGGDVEVNGEVILKGTPLIYRATEQVFIDINKINMDKFADQINQLYTKPEILKKSLIETISNRKEWCVSRNRVLGVPVALFSHKSNNELIKNQNLQNKILEKMAIDPTYFLKDECIEILTGFVPDPNDYRPYIFILDVWFDSGCVSYLLSEKLGEKTGEYSQADLYIEGKDQVRGWFQSSALLNYLLDEQLPFKGILSHGFLVDEQGFKMSKSKGNVVNLQETMEDYGAEILRIWIASSDYTNDVAVSKNILDKCAEIYRKIRNVMRYLISVVEHENIDEKFNEFPYLEKSILNELNDMKDRLLNNLVIKNEDKHTSLRKAFEEIYYFILRISEVYFNARKDTLYCDAKDNKERKAAINCSFILLRTLMILLTFLLPTTMEEIYQYCHFFDKNKHQSVLELSINDIKLNTYDNCELLSLNEKLENIRKEIENLKQSGQCKRNTDLIVFSSKEFNQPNDVIAKILGVLEFNKSNDDKIVISELENCERCNKKLGKLCDRCKSIMD